MDTNAQMTAATPVGTTPIQTPAPKVKAKGSKMPLMVLGCVVLLCVIVVGGLVAGTLVANNSNNNIPVFSDIVEKVEKVSKSDKDVAKDATAQAAAELDAYAANKNGTADNLPEKNVSAKFDYVVNLTSTPTTTSSTSASQAFTMKVTGTGEEAVKNKKIQFSTDMDINASTSGIAFSPKLQMRLFGDTTDQVMYFNISNIPNLGASLDTSSFANKWIKLDTKELKDELSSMGASSTSTTPSTLTPDQINKIKDILQSDTIINNFKREPDQIVANNVRANCFSLTLDNNALKQLGQQLEALSPLPSSSSPLSSTGSTSTTPSAVNTDSTLIVSGCAGRKDNLLYNMKMTLTTKDSTANVSMDLTMNFHDYNSDITVQEPTADINFKDLITQLLTSSLQKSNTLDTNTFDNSFDSNSFDNSLLDNSFGNSFDNTSF